MKHQMTLLVVLIVAILLSVGLIPAAALQPGEQALVKIAWQDPGDLDRVGAAGTAVYARLSSNEEQYLLAGATSKDIEGLRAQGLDVTLLDGNMRGATYYLAYLMPGQPPPDWDAYGQMLLDDGTQVLLRATAQAAERLVGAGVKLRAITFDPKPLRPATVSSAFPTVIDPDPTVQAIVDQVSSSTVYSYTGDLSGEWPVDIGGAPYTITTRHTSSGEPIEKATQFAYEHLQSLGLTLEYHDWSISGYTGRNVIGELPGLTNPDDIFIIGAHLDDMSTGPIAPGADDNASGSVATLIAADILTQYLWGCTLRFALWTGEEQGLLGSRAYAQRSYNNGENIVGYLNLDMIAWNDIGSNPDITLHANKGLPATLSLAELFDDVVTAYSLDLDPTIVRNGLGASDHASFWDYGYTAILGIEDTENGDFNPYYHTEDDLLEHLDMSYYTDFVKASIATFVHMSDCLIPCDTIHDIDFSWIPISPTTGETVVYTGTATSDLPITFDWAFGDGGTGWGSTVTHTYMVEGEYSAVMTATNACDRDVVSHTVTVARELAETFALYLPVVAGGQ